MANLRAYVVKHSLLDFLRSHFRDSSDADLARRFGIAPPTLSRIRHGRQVASWILLAVHEKTKIPLKALRHLSGDFREHTGVSSVELSEVEVVKYLAELGIEERPQRSPKFLCDNSISEK